MDKLCMYIFCWRNKIIFTYELFILVLTYLTLGYLLKYLNIIASIRTEDNVVDVNNSRIKKWKCKF